LSPQQEAAADLLAIGKPVTQVAADVGVTRQTVSEWFNQNLAFRVVFNCRRAELWARASDRLRALFPKALDALEKAVDDGDSGNIKGSRVASGGACPPDHSGSRMRNSRESEQKKVRCFRECHWLSDADR
jgi:hypothetical protein